MAQINFSPPRVIAAVHLLPSEISRAAQACPRNKIIDHAVLHAGIAVDGGAGGVYFQDTRDVPWGTSVHPETQKLMTDVGRELRRTFPKIVLGVSCMAHGAKEPLSIAQAIDANFVRLKVYVGVMVKMEGLVTGCAHEAIQHRAQIGAENVAILADVYDRLGEPLAPMPLPEACHQAVNFGRADALVLTGKSVAHSQAMFDEVRPLGLPAPLILGGGATAANAKLFASRADAFIVHGAFARKGLPSQNGVPVEWDVALVREFVNAL